MDPEMDSSPRLGRLPGMSEADDLTDEDDLTAIYEAKFNELWQQLKTQPFKKRPLFQASPTRPPLRPSIIDRALLAKKIPSSTPMPYHRQANFTPVNDSPVSPINEKSLKLAKSRNRVSENVRSQVNSVDNSNSENAKSLRNISVITLSSLAEATENEPKKDKTVNRKSDKLEQIVNKLKHTNVADRTISKPNIKTLDIMQKLARTNFKKERQTQTGDSLKQLIGGLSRPASQAASSCGAGSSCRRESSSSSKDSSKLSDILSAICDNECFRACSEKPILEEAAPWRCPSAFNTLSGDFAPTGNLEDDESLNSTFLPKNIKPKRVYKKKKVLVGKARKSDVFSKSQKEQKKEKKKNAAPVRKDVSIQYEQISAAGRNGSEDRTKQSRNKKKDIMRTPKSTKLDIEEPTSEVEIEDIPQAKNEKNTKKAKMGINESTSKTSQREVETRKDTKKTRMGLEESTSKVLQKDDVQAENAKKISMSTSKASQREDDTQVDDRENASPFKNTQDHLLKGGIEKGTQFRNKKEQLKSAYNKNQKKMNESLNCGSEMEEDIPLENSRITRSKSKEARTKRDIPLSVAPEEIKSQRAHSKTKHKNHREPVVDGSADLDDIVPVPDFAIIRKRLAFSEESELREDNLEVFDTPHQTESRNEDDRTYTGISSKSPKKVKMSKQSVDADKSVTENSKPQTRSKEHQVQKAKSLRNKKQQLKSECNKNQKKVNESPNCGSEVEKDIPLEDSRITRLRSKVDRTKRSISSTVTPEEIKKKNTRSQTKHKNHKELAVDVSADLHDIVHATPHQTESRNENDRTNKGISSKPMKAKMSKKAEDAKNKSTHSAEIEEGISTLRRSTRERRPPAPRTKQKITYLGLRTSFPKKSLRNTTSTLSNTNAFPPIAEENEYLEGARIPEETFKEPSPKKKSIKTGRVTKRSYVPKQAKKALQILTNSNIDRVDIECITSKSLDQMLTVSSDKYKMKWSCKGFPRFFTSNDTPGVGIALARTNPDNGAITGYMKIEPGRVKPKKLASEHSFTFVVLSGEGEFGIENVGCPASTTDSFIVSEGNEYYIKNTSSKETLNLFFTRIPRP